MGAWNEEREKGLKGEPEEREAAKKLADESLRGQSESGRRSSRG